MNYIEEGSTSHPARYTWLTVYRAHQVLHACRIEEGLYESSRAVTQVDGLPPAPSPVHREIALNLGREKIAKMGHKNEDISESVNSFGPGAIFLPRLGQYLSRNALVGPILFLERNSLGREGFFTCHWNATFFMKF